MLHSILALPDAPPAGRISRGCGVIGWCSFRVTGSRLWAWLLLKKTGRRVFARASHRGNAGAVAGPATRNLRWAAVGCRAARGVCNVICFRQTGQLGGRRPSLIDGFGSDLDANGTNRVLDCKSVTHTDTHKQGAAASWESVWLRARVSYTSPGLPACRLMMQSTVVGCCAVLCHTADATGETRASVLSVSV